MESRWPWFRACELSIEGVEIVKEKEKEEEGEERGLTGKGGVAICQIHVSHQAASAFPGMFIRDFEN